MARRSRPADRAAGGVDPRQMQVGDLVYVGIPQYGVARAGVNLGGGQWIAVTPATGQVVVEPLPKAPLFGVRRATLPAPATPTPAPKGMAGYTKIGCGVVTPPPALAQGGVIGTTTADPTSTLVSTSG